MAPKNFSTHVPLDRIVKLPQNKSVSITRVTHIYDERDREKNRKKGEREFF